VLVVLAAESGRTRESTIYGRHMPGLGANPLPQDANPERPRPDLGQHGTALVLGPRLAPDGPLPWSDLAAAGWRPTTADVRRGFAGARDGLPAEPVVPNSRASAVLVLVVPGPDAGDGACVVLIERSHTSGAHRGEIAFPGGVAHEGESSVQAALREAHEEIGVPAEDVEVVGTLDAVPIVSGFLISPVVGVAAAPPAFVLNPSEVERVLVVPLAQLIREEAHWFHALHGDQRSLQPFFAVADTVGWGTTGALLAELLSAAAAGHRLRGD
jgi:8-oxo-dGTP pyrophosphatase MutT (NUDIX family)